MKLLEILGIKERPVSKKKLIIMLVIFFIVLFTVMVVPVAAYQRLYENKIYAGVSVGGVNLGGLTKDQAEEKLNQQIDNLKMRGLNFYYNDTRLNVDFNMLSPTDPDLAYSILSFNVDSMVNSAFNYGRLAGYFFNLKNQAVAILKNQELPAVYELDSTELSDILRNKFSALDKAGKNAGVKFLPNNELTVEPESFGLTMDYDQAIDDLKSAINLNSINDIKISAKLFNPDVSRAEVENMLPAVKEVLAPESLTLHYQNKKWIVLRKEYEKWLSFVKKDGQVVMQFGQDLFAEKLKSISQSINVLPQDAKFTIKDNKVTEFQPSISGLELDISASADKINQDFFINKITNTDLVIKTSESNLKTADVNTFGIEELIGEGVSDFSGSHANRIKNIKNAVNRLNGILIPPGEFSIVDAIGEVSAATGYFPEFVIKGDRTVSEYGGGLCQIGTTIFRAALYSGLPITERRPHSYIVSYYKPIGMDATIYGPHPDLKFINDTGHYILLQIKIEGTKLTFQFWGKSDGRKVEITDPVLYNWTSPPEPKIVENPKLKPGEKNLVEHARKGADAYFYRHIILPSGEKKDETWKSHYVPWPDIYEIGVSPATTETADSAKESGADANSSAGTASN